MKKLLAIAIIALTSLAASAQGWYVGGELGYWHDGKDNTNQLTILPDFGYSFNDTWTVGTVLGWDYLNLNRKGVSTNLFKINPFIRNTFWKSDNGFVSVFCDLKAGLGLGWSHFDDTGNSDTACTWEVGLSPGIALNFTPHFSFVTHFAFLGYKGANSTAKAGGHYPEGGFLMNSETVTFGVFYNF